MPRDISCRDLGANNIRVFGERFVCRRVDLDAVGNYRIIVTEFQRGQSAATFPEQIPDPRVRAGSWAADKGYLHQNGYGALIRDSRKPLNDSLLGCSDCKVLRRA